MKKFIKPVYVLIVILIFASFLRFYKLTNDPPSLFGDELDLGYQAYSILKTGRDYQGNFMPINFHSIAEWRTPLYLYSAVPTVALFGITPLGVRLPAAIFGILDVLAIYLLTKEFLSFGQPQTNKHWRSVIAALLMAISPWSLQYSRAGFEVTEMLFFLMFGIALFFKSLSKPKFLWLSVASLVITPWIYSTAKLFTPMLFVVLFIIFKKEIFLIKSKYIVSGAVSGLILGLPLIYGIFFGGGSQRFNYISVFADPTTEANIGFARETEGRIRGETGAGLSPKLTDKIIYNKFTYWGEAIIKNYLSAFSTDFLFIKGDPNPRQSLGRGELLRIEIIGLILGMIFFFAQKDRSFKIKLLLGSWLVLAPWPSALTVDGGNHATRLILMLPPLLILVAVGWMAGVKLIAVRYRKFAIISISALYLVSFLFYLHEYYYPYPWNSERWWHYGWGQAISEIKSIDKNYDKVIISMSGEPAWIFFAGYYQFDPAAWQKNFPVTSHSTLDGFGGVSYIDKFYFGSPSKDIQLYGLGKVIDTKTLYLANASEDGDNLILHPEKSPSGLKLIKSIAFPSGEPAFYLFSGTKN